MGVTSVNESGLAPAARYSAAPAPQLRTAGAAAGGAPTGRVRLEPNEEQVQPADLSAKASPAPVVDKDVQLVQPSTTRIRVDEESKRIVTQIIDANNEVIRQIPPKEVLEFSARFKKLQGLLFDERA